MAKEKPKEASESAAKPEAPPVESGVEGLIGRLREQGIAEGRSQAEAIVAEAKQRAAEIVAAARQEGDTLLVKAREEAGKMKAAGEDSIRLAMRDTVLAMEGDLIREFTSRLQGLVRGVLADPAFLQRLILEIAGRTAPKAGATELLLPADIVSLADLQRTPEEAKPGTLMNFVLSVGGNMLRDGVSFGVFDDGEAGIRVRLVQEDVQIDLTEGAVSRLLLRHMLPRFRALLRGIVTAEVGAQKQAAPGKKAA